MFDPYLQWFKIPADRRPPSHYELLEISPEDADDPIAIHNAAERRSDQLLRHTSGPHAEECVRIAEELNVACKVLIDPDSRHEYDDQLRRAAASRKNGKPGPRQAAEEPAVATVTPLPTSARKPWMLPVVGGVAVLLVLAGGTLAFFFNSPEKKEQKLSDPIATSTPVPVAIAASTEAAAKQEGEAPVAAKPETGPATTAALKTAPAPPAPPRLAPDPKEPKLPVPDDEALEKASQRLHEKYKRDYAVLRTSEDRLAMAAKLLQPGRENRKEPADWFALLSEARDLSVAAERPRLAVAAIEEIDRHFIIDHLDMATTALSSIEQQIPVERSLRNDAKVKSLVSVAMGRIKPALKDDNFPAALKFVSLCEEALARTKADKKAIAAVAAKKAEILGLLNEFQAIAAARRRLKETPDDPSANLTVGFHVACECGKWDEGLPLLAKGSNPELQRIAKLELERPAESKNQLNIADLWWTYARQNGGRSELEVQERAAYWYDKALALFIDGADRARAIERISDVSRILLANGTRLAPGTVQGRDLENRTLLLREGGGTMQSEEAVERGLIWIASHQSVVDGSWGTDTFALAGHCNCPDEGRKHDIAGTAFGLLPLLAAGNSHRQGRFRVSVDAGLNFLATHQMAEGNFVTTPAFAPYENALATLALCEDYAMTKDSKDDKYLLAARKAVYYIINTQSPYGGWGYEPRSLSPDTSATLWQIIALKTAINAGIYVPKETFDPMDNYLELVCERSSPGYWYKPPRFTAKDNMAPRPTLLPDGILCRELLDWKQDTSGLARSARALVNIPVINARERPGMYYLYFSRQALHHFGGPEWEEWNAKTRDLIVSMQDKGDEFAHEHRRGSWSPVGELWMEEGGRLMSTSMAIQALEVYYSTVPLNGYGSAVLND